uniref:Uncharacterized protein n=1 Tax=Molossus molossus TaxID=27622 RepID=A0A7J8E2A6_MOLMO|nr:hypothetical protein HJG59_008963 [Molossus molossus]
MGNHPHRDSTCPRSRDSQAGWGAGRMSRSPRTSHKKKKSDIGQHQSLSQEALEPMYLVTSFRHQSRIQLGSQAAYPEEDRGRHQTLLRFSLKRKGILTLATTRMDRVDIMLSEKPVTQTDAVGVHSREVPRAIGVRDRGLERDGK